MPYHQITQDERYTLQQLLHQRASVAYIAKVLERHRSTIYREIRRNATQGGHYRATHAQGYSNTRRSRSRRNYRITDQDWSLVERLLREGRLESGADRGSSRPVRTPPDQP